MTNFTPVANKPKKEKLHSSGKKSLITVDPSLPSFEDHPYFKKKAATVKALLEKVGLPGQFSKKSHP